MRLQLFAFRWCVFYRIQLQFIVYLLMVLGLGMAAWRMVLELGSGQMAVSRGLSHLDRTDSLPYAVKFCRVFYPLLLPL